MTFVSFADQRRRLSLLQPDLLEIPQILRPRVQGETSECDSERMMAPPVSDTA
jgi:hypothetical protein